MSRRIVFHHQGFTIVELLIVISVITILAAITLVAYNGVQNNARDTTVQSDLRKTADNIEEFRLGTGTNSYPMATQADLQALIKVSKDSYIVNSSSGSVSYCRNDTDFALLGRSASKNAFTFSSKNGLQAVVFTGNLIAQCALNSITPSDSGYGAIWLLKGTGDPSGYGWQSWVN